MISHGVQEDPRRNNMLHNPVVSQSKAWREVDMECIVRNRSSASRNSGREESKGNAQPSDLGKNLVQVHSNPRKDSFKFANRNKKVPLPPKRNNKAPNNDNSGNYNDRSIDRLNQS